MLDDCKKRAADLEKRLKAAAAAGDKVTMKKLQKELTSTNKTIQQLQGSAKTAEQVLRRLDTATPKELKKTLKELQLQLNGIQRGTSAWDAQMAKIRAVKAEIQKVNAEMMAQKSLWSRFNSWLNNTQTAIMGLVAAVAGLVMAGRKAVSEYAEMEEQMANTRKFTGMTEEGVKELNEAFRNMDTRTSREQLNLLAQEAGRLGKSTLEDVLGYVRAADIINVALSDMGEGATQSIAKLSNIFKIEDEYGTYDSMVKIGSVVNVLSQNCTASKPYLVEFANRLAGVGSQANISLQNIIGLGAVLDANAQKVESSSTAIGQVLTRMYRDPAKYARAAGLDVQKFSDLLKKDANEALLTLLETLGKAGNMDVLAPMFADMGENGARVITTLSTLSKHIDEVRWQQENANKAFNEGTSVLNEYNIFNNTVQSSIDKARKRVNELAIELGEKLYPLMRHIYTSSSMMLRVLNVMVDFITKYKYELAGLVVAIGAYNLIANLSTINTNLLSAAIKTKTFIVNAAKIAVLSLKIAYYELTGQIIKAEAATRVFNQTTKSNPWAFIISAIITATVALAVFIQKINEAKKAQEEAAKAEKEFKESLIDISEQSAQYANSEILRLRQLYEVAMDESRAREERIKAAQKMQSLYPDVFGNLTTEEILTGKAKKAYDNLRESILEVARARAAAEKIQKNESALLDLEEKEKKLKKDRDEALREYEKRREQFNQESGGNSIVSMENYTPAHVKTTYDATIGDSKKLYDEANKAYIDNLNYQKFYRNANKELEKKYNLATAASEDSSEPEIDFNPTGGGGGGSAAAAEDKFKAEKEWREKQEALAKIAYAQGAIDYLEYTKSMDEIAVKFYDKQLEHEDLTDLERLKIQADYYDALKKQSEDQNKATVEQENVRYNEQMAELKQFYIDGSLSKKSYDLKTEEAEIEHQRRLVNILKKGSKERLQAEEQLNNLLIRQMENRQREVERIESKIKNDYFGLNSAEKAELLSKSLDALDSVYQRELAAAGDNAAEKLRIEEAYQKARLAIIEQYSEEGVQENQNALEKFNSWFESEGGKQFRGSMSTLVSGMSSIFSQLTSLMQADLELQTAMIEKRYDKEIQRAQGNSYKVAQLEKKKDREIAEAKNEANRKMFAMQVIQAVAQTAQNAISAYGAGLQVGGPAGLILAPIAAAMAVAAGAIQIAAITKQQQAAEAQGYAEGGFTPDGDKYKEVGVVHAGEWVASQRLVRNPKTRPILEALDYAQKNNRIGSIRLDDVSRSISAPMMLAARSSAPATQLNWQNSSDSDKPNVVFEDLNRVIDSLNNRLNEPIAAVTTVTGDYGINKAQERYDKLLRNKSPKSFK